MGKYDKLDELVLARIGAASDATPVQFNVLRWDAGIHAEGERLADIEKAEAKHGRTTAPGWRIVERRLQALRKAGTICSTTKGWVLAIEAS
ncbi:hypothetical protein ACXIVK_27900 [Paraburkholderia caledonica]|jgi:hypothetical protein